MLALSEMPSIGVSALFDSEIDNGLPVLNVYINDSGAVRVVIGCIKDYRYGCGGGEYAYLVVNLVASRASTDDLSMFYDSIAELCRCYGNDELYDFL